MQIHTTNYLKHNENIDKTGKGGGIHHFLAGPFPLRYASACGGALSSELEVEPSVRLKSLEQVWPVSLRTRRSCSLPWRIAFALAGGSLFASRSGNSKQDSSTTLMQKSIEGEVLSSILHQPCPTMM